MRDFLVGIFFVLLFAAMMGFSSGCGGELVPGGRMYLRITDGQGKTAVLQSNKDTAFSSLSLDPNTGVLTVEGYNANASALGAIQGPVVMNGQNVAGAVTNNLIGVLAQVVPYMNQGGGQLVNNPLTGALSVQPIQDDPAQAADRAYLVQRAMDCPFFKAAGTTAQMVSLVQHAPASMLGELRMYVDGLSVAVPTTQP